MEIRVSVIIPVFNAEKYLAECLESVLKQTLKEIEIICIDDGSSDGSGSILSFYGQKDSRLKILKQENKGPGAARNRGISCAEGEFVCFLDADDYYLSEQALEDLYNAAVREKVSVCAGLLQRNADGKQTKDLFLRKYLNGQKIASMRYSEFQHDFQYVCYLYRRAFLTERQIWFPDLRRFQDPPFFVQALYYAEKFLIVQTEFYCCRMGHQNTNYTGQKRYDLLRGLIFNIRFAKEHHLEKLAGITVNRINRDYFDVLYNGLEKDFDSMKESFMELDGLAEETDFRIEPWEIYQAKNGCHKKIPLFENIERKIPQKKDIVVYGAGNIGKKCVLYLRNTGYANVMMWVDHYKHGTRYYGRKLQDISDVTEGCCDRILIAIEDRETAGKVKAELSGRGIGENKIIMWNEASEE